MTYGCKDCGKNIPYYGRCETCYLEKSASDLLHPVGLDGFVKHNEVGIR